jgi:3-dehydroquinate synthase
MTTLPLSDYNIYIGTDIWDALNGLIKEAAPSRIAVLVDENTKEFCLPIFKEKTNFDYTVIEISSGELHKTIDTCQQIWGEMMSLKMNRNALLLNLGGGVIGDMGGFCASTFKRGMRFVQMPTTLLSQVDASIGGKLGIDFMDVKNSIGVFNNPQAVFVNTDLLETLSARELRSGYAEMIKHSLIANATDWKELLGLSDLAHIKWDKLLLSSLKVKQRIVEEDPFEHGIRKALNFGHTIGHAIESHFLHTEDRLLHGEAIAAGMICESYLSYLKSGLSKADLEEITTYLLKIYGKCSISDSVYPELLAIMRQDKKNVSTEINVTLLNKIGTCQVNQIGTPEEIIKCLDYYNNL